MRSLVFLVIIGLSFTSYGQEYLFILETDKSVENGHSFTKCFLSNKNSEKVVDEYYKCGVSRKVWDAIKICKRKDNKTSNKEVSAYYYKSLKDCQGWRSDAIDGSST